jgi:hypothetical protein
VEELWKNWRKILRALPCQAARRGRIVENLWKEIARARLKIFLQFFHSSSTILPRLEEFGASGFAWRRIVEGTRTE